MWSSWASCLSGTRPGKVLQYQVWSLYQMSELNAKDGVNENHNRCNAEPVLSDRRGMVKGCCVSMCNADIPHRASARCSNIGAQIEIIFGLSVVGTSKRAPVSLADTAVLGPLSLSSFFH